MLLITSGDCNIENNLLWKDQHMQKPILKTFSACLFVKVAQE